MNHIKLLFRWLEVRHESIKKVAEQNDFDSDYMRGFNQGMKKAAEMYEEEIKSIRTALDGYMVEDVKFEECSRCESNVEETKTTSMWHGDLCEVCYDDLVG